MPKHGPTTDALEILDRLVGDDVQLGAMIAEECVHAQVAPEIDALLTSRGLTQRELAERIGTTHSGAGPRVLWPRC